ncbi:hypothetical protein F2P81_002878 [Scophthalmus maximus]|uniref:Uncharacterized protein n=1 Tax=Scophthalmus maximus TaxID=52904 RepID=A0A6A4TNF1_SCOMX|nr:hypothetical protein F2P81_002878 [Scophthalmus maximus]
MTHQSLCLITTMIHLSVRDVIDKSSITHLACDPVERVILGAELVSVRDPPPTRSLSPHRSGTSRASDGSAGQLDPVRSAPQGPMGHDDEARFWDRTVRGGDNTKQSRFRLKTGIFLTRFCGQPLSVLDPSVHVTAASVNPPVRSHFGVTRAKVSSEPQLDRYRSVNASRHETPQYDSKGRGGVKLHMFTWRQEVWIFKLKWIQLTTMFLFFKILFS